MRAAELVRRRCLGPRRTLRYVEPLSDARTPLVDFFSILLVLSGTVKADTEVGRTSVRSASVANADNIRLPIGLLLVESALQSAAF